MAIGEHCLLLHDNLQTTYNTTTPTLTNTLTNTLTTSTTSSRERHRYHEYNIRIRLSLPDVDIVIIGIGKDNSRRDTRYLIVLHVITDPFITTRTTIIWISIYTSNWNRTGGVRTRRSRRSTGSCRCQFKLAITSLLLTIAHMSYYSYYFVL